MSKLPINLNDLLRQRTVESERIEYKAGWNPDSIIRTLCAFANDFENLGGGYVVIGQDFDAHGQPIFPPIDLSVHPLAKRPDGDSADQVTDQVAGEVVRLLAAAAQGEHTRNALQEALGLKHTPHFRQAFLLPALEAGLIEMTLPDKPRSSNQRYRLTQLGQRWLDAHPVGVQVENRSVSHGR